MAGGGTSPCPVCRTSRAAGRAATCGTPSVLSEEEFVTEEIEIVIGAVLIGIGGTVVLDLWATLLWRFFGVPATNWAMVGRWVATCRDATSSMKISAKPRLFQESTRLAGSCITSSASCTACFLLAFGASDGCDSPRSFLQ